MYLSHAADTDGFAEIYVAGDCCGASVEPIKYVSMEVQRIVGMSVGLRVGKAEEVPVNGLWWEFFGGRGFDSVDPT